MITKHVFGRSIDYRFFPIVDGESVPAYEIVTALIYASAPSLAQKQYSDTSGAVGSAVTSWTPIRAERQAAEYKIVFPALEDSSPDEEEDYEEYWVNVRFRWEESGAIVFVCEKIFVWRPDALTSGINVEARDIYARESKIQTIQRRPNFVDEKIEIAIIEIDRVLRAKGYSRKRTFDRQSLNEPVAELATADACLDLAEEPNDIWMEKQAFHRAKYETARDSIPLGYDIDGDDDPSPNERAFSGAVALER